jgi:hypothetical protein
VPRHPDETSGIGCRDFFEVFAGVERWIGRSGVLGRLAGCFFLGDEREGIETLPGSQSEDWRNPGASVFGEMMVFWQIWRFSVNRGRKEPTGTTSVEAGERPADCRCLKCQGGEVPPG